MRKNFDFTGRKHFQRVKLQTIVGLSKLVGKGISNPHNLRRSLATLRAYSLASKAVGNGTFSSQVMQHHLILLHPIPSHPIPSHPIHRSSYWLTWWTGGGVSWQVACDSIRQCEDQQAQERPRDGGRSLPSHCRGPHHHSWHACRMVARSLQLPLEAKEYPSSCQT